jgi:group II intron reverse transcriptase/maturase
MATVIDLEPFFTADAVKAAYTKYKESKTDRFKSNRINIPMGADGVTWEDFERNLDRNVQNISRRVLNGSYQFYPFREKDVEKPGGGVRTLSIASIRDALVQRQLYEALYESAEAMFAQPRLDQVSFAYRRGKSAPYAAHRIWQAYRRDGYCYAFDADLRKFFDTLDHDRLMELVHAWISRDSVAGKMLWRYIRTDRVPYDSYPHGSGWKKHFMKKKPKREPRCKGVPQGGVLSGMLANLYLHEFDRWVVEELSQQFDLRYFRYADDFVMLTRREEDARALYDPVAERLTDPLLLEIHPMLDTPESKTKISVIADGDLVFVGFQFMEDRVRAKPENIRRFKKRFLAALHKERSLKSDSGHWDERLRLTIRYCVNPKILGPPPELCTTCGLPKDRRRSWMAFFATVVTDEDQLRQLDRWMRRRICRYFRDKYRVRLGRKELRQAGMKTLVSEHYRAKQAHDNLCNCERDARSTE